MFAFCTQGYLVKCGRSGGSMGLRSEGRITQARPQRSTTRDTCKEHGNYEVMLMKAAW